MMFLSASFPWFGHEIGNESYLYYVCRAMVKIIIVQR